MIVPLGLLIKSVKIHDNHTMRTIDFANGLEKHFALTSISINFVFVNKVDNWHFRLGHLSKDKIYVLSTKFDYISSKTCNDFCQICPLAKQKRLSFPLSIYSSNKFFYLLHVDI